MIDLENNLHGDVFNIAYHIGEDLCKGGQVLVTEDVIKRLKSKENFKNSKFTLV